MQTHYVFWTGGYDSTFRILQLLYTKDVLVQPIYIFMPNVDTENKGSRRSGDLELKVMDNIRSLIPLDLSSKLLKTWVVTSLPPDDTIKNLILSLRTKQERSTKRLVTQYERMARVCKVLSLQIEVGMIYKPDNWFDKYIRPQLTEAGDTCRLKSNPEPPEYIMYKDFIYPIQHWTKEDYYNIAKEKGFEHILHQSWSCWKPKQVGSLIKACERCKICNERFIPHVEIQGNVRDKYNLKSSETLKIIL